jgi:hypothetical protein
VTPIKIEEHTIHQTGGAFARVTVGGERVLATVHVALVTPQQTDDSQREAVRGVTVKLGREALAMLRDAINLRLAEPWEEEAPKASPEPCDKPPPGWVCQRAKGHPGPCAAVPGPG